MRGARTKYSDTYHQCDQMRLWKKCPKCCPNQFFVNINKQLLPLFKEIRIFWISFVIVKKVPKENNRPIRENSPNLVTLLTIWSMCVRALGKSRQWEAGRFGWRESRGSAWWGGGAGGAHPSPSCACRLLFVISGCG
jgi:hypothetical protein